MKNVDCSIDASHAINAFPVSVLSNPSPHKYLGLVGLVFQFSQSQACSQIHSPCFHQGDGEREEGRKEGEVEGEKKRGREMILWLIYLCVCGSGGTEF